MTQEVLIAIISSGAAVTLLNFVHHWLYTKKEK